jgi:prevent-host-death family protein
VRVIGITTVRQDATRVIRQAQAADEPILVVLRSEPAAYIVGAAQYDALIEELKDLRRELFAREVDEAEAEARRGDLPTYESAADLMNAIRAEKDG